jgi:ribosomal protein S27E
MTVERRMIVGIDDIKAVTFECLNCKTRTTVPSASLRDVPRTCNSCSTIWWTNADASAHVLISGPASIGFIQAIVTLNVLIRENKMAFRILLEFDEPKAI